MKKRVKIIRKREKKNFISTVKGSLGSVMENRKQLKFLKNEELKKLKIRERELIKLIKARTKKQKIAILKRHEKGKERLGITLLKMKEKGLGNRLSVEKISLKKIDKEIKDIGKKLEKDL